ncbi:hypothetical protein HYZ98_04180 [Candidatus Peregrinibacteria bacterium]|nr:hypothetical protein [Candidatus Peregrinibacteria bacterium]
MSDFPLRRIYKFSDTYGQSTSPLQDDADARISTDFRSFPLYEQDRDFDIYGREKITAHILRLIMQLHAEIDSADYLSSSIKKEFRKTTTGIFINAAPRTGKQNGIPFYVATAKNIRIVTTDLSALASVKEKIESLAHLPNTKNNLYSPTEQFRSSYAAWLLRNDHGLSLDKDSLDAIPDYPEDQWELAYVDRFGNLVTFTKNPKKTWAELQNKARHGEKSVRIFIGETSKRVRLTSSLRDADPDELVIYPNEGNIEILRKWDPADESSEERLRESAYRRFHEPYIGGLIKIDEREK